MINFVIILKDVYLFKLKLQPYDEWNKQCFQCISDGEKDRIAK